MRSSCKPGVKRANKQIYDIAATKCSHHTTVFLKKIALFPGYIQDGAEETRVFQMASTRHW